MFLRYHRINVLYLFMYFLNLIFASQLHNKAVFILTAGGKAWQ